MSFEHSYAEQVALSGISDALEGPRCEVRWSLVPKILTLTRCRRLLDHMDVLRLASRLDTSANLEETPPCCDTTSLAPVRLYEYTSH